MSALNVPATVAGLDLVVVAAALERHACNITDAAQELRVPASDLRRLMWANPQLQDQAFEVVESRLDTAEKNIAEALHSDDSRRRKRLPDPLRLGANGGDRPQLCPRRRVARRGRETRA
jgi:hypothetical protein